MAFAFIRGLKSLYSLYHICKYKKICYNKIDNSLMTPLNIL